jgi:hypothetical protein
MIGRMKTARQTERIKGEEKDSAKGKNKRRINGSTPCSRRFEMLLCAFSNSSSRMMVYGFLSTASVSNPPSS